MYGLAPLVLLHGFCLAEEGLVQATGFYFPIEHSCNRTDALFVMINETNREEK
jgi:hypothetical protein